MRINLDIQFVRYAEKKLNECLAQSDGDKEPPVKNLLSEGKDERFDRSISLLGNTARWKPKPVIDSVMFWRKTKSDASSQASYKLAQEMAYQARTNLRSANDVRYSKRFEALREEVIRAERKSLISIFILCRVLMEIVKKTPIEALGDDLSSKLEEIVFKQLKVTDPNILTTSSIRSANWSLFAELLGEMSDSRFVQVGDEFIADLEKCTGTIPKERELNVQLVIHGMKHLKIKVYPMDALEESSDFLLSLGKFFSKVTNPGIKGAYARVFCDLLLPVAETATAEFNYPNWASAMELLYKQAEGLLARPKYWTYAFPLACTVLCVSPSEAFAKNWLNLFDGFLHKYKEKSLRPLYLTSISRLIWVYLIRCTESLNNTTKKLEHICKPLIGHGIKKFWTSVDNSSAASLAYSIRVIGHAHLQFALENIYFQLIFPGSQPSDFISLTLDSIYAERVIIAIRAFIFTLDDYENSTKPEFPTDEVLHKFMFTLPTKSASKETRQYSISLSEFKEQFSKLVGRFLVLCDNAFGYNISINEEKQVSSVPFKTPIPVTFHFGNSRENSTSTAQKQIYYDVFCFLIEAIPWCYPSTIPTTKIIELLFRNSVHPDDSVKSTCSRILKNLMIVKDPITILPIVTKYLFNIDSKICSTYNASFSSHTDFKDLLALYIELLETWKAQIAETKKQQSEQQHQPLWPPWGANTNQEESVPPKRSEDRNLHNIWNIIEEVEGNGLFFLCSQDRNIRQCAIRILRLTAEFDDLLSSDSSNIKRDSVASSTSNDSNLDLISSRIINFFEKTEPLTLYKKNSHRISLSSPELLKIHKLFGKHSGGLIYIAESDSGVETAIWLKLFPVIMKACFETYPIAVALCRNIVCGKLVQMHETVLEYSRIQGMEANSGFPLKHPMRTHPELVVEQWRMYLIVASTTLTQTDEQKLHIPNNFSSHGRKKSVQKVTIHHQKITSARSVFKMLIPLFSVSHPVVRDAVVTSLTWVNINIYVTLIACLETAVSDWKLDYANYLSQPRKDHFVKSKLERVATEITHILSATSHYLKEKQIYEDTVVLKKLLNFLNEIKSFYLSRPEVQSDPTCQRLRLYFASLLENVYLAVRQNPHKDTLMTYEMRVSYFLFVEEWTGVGHTENISRRREADMKKYITARSSSSEELHGALFTLEMEKNSLESQALSTLATLCYGPLYNNGSTADSTSMAVGFNSDSFLFGIDATFHSKKKNCVEIACRALKNVLLSNNDDIAIFQDVIANCYRNRSDDIISRSYFTTLAEVLLELDDYPCKVWQVLSLGLFKCGDSSVEVRRLALNLLNSAEQKFYGTNSCVRDYEISLLNNTPAVYKRAMFNLSSRFAQDHPDETFVVFSEMTMFFHQVDNVSRRDILAVLLPWVQTVELTIEPNSGVPSPSSTMVMNNLFEITVIFSSKIQNEVEALWVAIGNGKFPENVKAILDFIIHHSLERRSPQFVEHVRMIIVYLASTAAGEDIIDELISNLVPKCMIPQKPSPQDTSLAASKFPYVSNIQTLLDPQEKELSFSKGQLSIIFLVDILNDRKQYIESNFPLFLHICYVLLDHYTPIVNVQAREMLITIIHTLAKNTEKADELISLLRKKDSGSTWSYYELSNSKVTAPTPRSMESTINAILEIFADDVPDLRDQWAKVALSWATTCPVRHIACRSFQIFRCLLYFLDSSMLGDMLARLSNTIADENPDIQGFAMQILMTLRSITDQLSNAELETLPQLFWAAVACLGSTHEQEFMEALLILNKLIDKIDFNNPEIIEHIWSAFPQNKWCGKFEGLLSCLTNGLKSSIAYEPTLKMIGKLNDLKCDDALIGGEDRLCMTIVINMPRFLHALETGVISEDVMNSCLKLTEICEKENQNGFARIFTSLSKNRFRSKKDFLAQCVSGISNNYFPYYTGRVLVLLLGLLYNNTAWIKIETMELLEKLFPLADLQSSEFAGVGAEFISPLLRLLQTDYADQALNVLDKAGNIHGSPMDKKVLRMSLGDKSIRKEYELSSTIFGIPQSSGWAVPSINKTSNICRGNVHAVFYTCSVETDNDAMLPVAEEFEFHKEEIVPPGSKLQDNTDNMSLPEEENNGGSINHMYAELVTLDTFFTQNVPPTHTRNVSATDTEISDSMIDPVESAPQIYDKKVSIILNRSLARTASTTSFKTSLADSFNNNNNDNNGNLASLQHQELHQFGPSHDTNQYHESRSTNFGFKFHGNLRRGNISSPLASPINVAAPGRYGDLNTSNLISPKLYYNSIDTDLHNTYHALSDPNNESEENLELFVSRSGPFSAQSIMSDDSRSIQNSNFNYSDSPESSLVGNTHKNMSSPTSFDSFNNGQYVHKTSSTGSPTSPPQSNHKSDSKSPITPITPGSGSSPKASKSGNSGESLFKLESLLKSNPLGKGKKKSEKSRKFPSSSEGTDRHTNIGPNLLRGAPPMPMNQIDQYNQEQKQKHHHYHRHQRSKHSQDFTFNVSPLSFESAQPSSPSSQSKFYSGILSHKQRKTMLTHSNKFANGPLIRTRSSPFSNTVINSTDNDNTQNGSTSDVTASGNVSSTSNEP